MTQRVQLEESWLRHLEGEFEQPYMQALKAFLQAQKAARKVIFPHSSEIFAALNTTPLAETRVVILGQDPYHGAGQAHGLCFSVPDGIVVPPSLANIYKELRTDLGMDAGVGSADHAATKDEFSSGSLQGWARQGVLLLNSVLTVERGRAASHQGKGWETFTDRIVTVLNAECEGLVFLLWGAYAQRKGAIVDSKRHLVLKAPHPSPLAAHRGFFGCRHFSKANAYLRAKGKPEIDWRAHK